MFPNFNFLFTKCMFIGTPGQSEPTTPSSTPFRDQLSINSRQL